MNQIIKHSFEAVSLLTTNNGMLEVTIVPAIDQPDWLIPSNLILSVDAYNERIWTYLWQQQEVAVFHLLPRGQVPDKLIVLEGNTAVHRLALQTSGELRQVQVRISDVKDAELPERYLHTHAINSNNDDDEISDDSDIKKGKSNSYQPVISDIHDEKSNRAEGRFMENLVISYAFQTVTIDGVFYLVPDLDKIAHQLVDLDS